MEYYEMNEKKSEPEQEELRGKKFTAALAYLSWLVVIPIVYSSESKFIRYNANQGLSIAIAETIGVLATVVVTKVLWSVSIKLSLLVEVMMYAVILGVFGALALLGLLNVALGKKRKLPTFGRINLLKVDE
jgi:hypothetical protein